MLTTYTGPKAVPAEGGAVTVAVRGAFRTPARRALPQVVSAARAPHRNTLHKHCARQSHANLSLSVQVARGRDDHLAP